MFENFNSTKKLEIHEVNASQSGNEESDQEDEENVMDNSGNSENQKSDNNVTMEELNTLEKVTSIREKDNSNSELTRDSISPMEENDLPEI